MFNLRFAQHSAQNYAACITFIATAITLCSCNNTLYLGKNEYLYKGTKVYFTDSTSDADNLKSLASDLEDLSKSKPNKKTLGIYPLKLWLYNLGDTGIDIYVNTRYGINKKIFFFNFDTIVKKLNVVQPESHFRRWLKYKAGQPPSLLDTSAIEDTKIRIENYLYNRGFFHPEVNYTVELTKKHTAIVQYPVTLNTLYRMRDITYEIEDANLNLVVSKIPTQSFLKQGEAFDVAYLNAERSRLANYLVNNGYYGFEKEFVYFEVDTSRQDSLDVYVKINPPPDDSVYHRYKINKVYVYPKAEDAAKTFLNDTISYSYKKTRADSVKIDYYLIEPEEYYKPKSVANNIFINTGEYYSADKVRQTVGSFSNLGIFKYTTVQHVEIDSEKFIRYLDAIIKLEPLATSTFSYEINASTTSDYLLGNSLTVNYLRRNTFHRMDQLNIRLYGGIESQVTGGTAYINTSEISTNIGLSFPRFFWPFNISVPKRYFPKTTLSSQFKYQDRIDLYSLFNTSFQYGNQWFEVNKAKTHILNPVVINFIKLPTTSPTFDSILASNNLLLLSYQEQLIIGPNYTFIYNPQVVNDKRNDFYFRGSAEIDGTLIQLGNASFNGFKLNTVNNPHTIFSLPYSNLTRIDVEMRDYYDVNSGSKLVGRFETGIAVPYWNSQVVPYVKQFFVGGANSIRAFPIRKLGPGGYIHYDTIAGEEATIKAEDESGDFKLEMNLEYRFNIISIIKGALFCDFGNVWTLNEDSARLGTQFQFNNFYKEIAVGPGAGLRFDVKYFVFRIDAAYPLYDPALDGPIAKMNRPVYEENGITFPKKKIAWNIAIGYPF